MTKAESRNPVIGVALASLWRSLRRDLFDDYRPELHYMRGPGPKWRAKHQNRAQASVMAGLSALPCDGGVAVPA
jgi:hypothetical protein